MPRFYRSSFPIFFFNFDNQRLVPPLKEMTPLFSRCVDPLRECPLKPLHACHKIGLWRPKQEVIVIAHEKVGVNPSPRLFDGLLQRFEPYPTFPILPEDHLSSIPAAHDVVDRTPELHSRLPCHETILYLQNGNVNSLFHGLTPSVWKSQSRWMMLR